MIIVVGSLAAFLYNLSVYYFTRAASALAVMIAANFIKVLLISLSAVQTGVDSAVQVNDSFVSYCSFLPRISNYDLRLRLLA